MFGAKLCVHYWEVVPCSEGPLSEVPLYSQLYTYLPGFGTCALLVLCSLQDIRAFRNDSDVASITTVPGCTPQILQVNPSERLTSSLLMNE